jgi:uracil-DNA glycosylase family 4
MNDKLNRLIDLYNSIHNCSLCCGMRGTNIQVDKEKVIRKVFDHILEAEIFIVAQSLAENQVRLSGIPYHYINGKMSRSGNFLENYFNKISYTLNPYFKKNKLVYTTDIIQCFPGRKKTGSGDNTPTINEINNCKQWFIRELDLLKPKIILLFGLPATQTFFKIFLKLKVDKLSNYILQPILFNGITIYCLPHPTSMVKNKSELYDKTFNLVKDLLLNHK